jgi:uncharacterized damage-inducible protein DinB
MSSQPAIIKYYSGWETYQSHLVQAIAPLTSDQLKLKSAPHMWSVMTLAAHIIAARVYWFHTIMGEGPESLKPLQDWDEEGEPSRNAAELVEGLIRTWTLVDDCLNRWTDSDLDQTFQRSGSDESFTRQWIIWHLLEHDLHHGGELSFLLGSHHVPALDL